jgi:hypothetical protein
VEARHELAHVEVDGVAILYIVMRNLKVHTFTYGEKSVHLDLSRKI